MSIRLIALDLDGTLLDSRKQLTEQNRRALEACISKGIHIVPCTGRTARGIPEAVKCIPGIRYAITVNGGMIEDMQTGEVLDRHLLDKKTALDVIDLVADRHVMYDAYIDGLGIMHITKENFQTEVMESDKTVLLDFWATWCGPCRMIAPVLEEVAQEREDVKVCKIDVDKEPELAQQFQIMSIPTLIVMEQGRVVNKALGAMPKNSVLALLP